MTNKIVSLKLLFLFCQILFFTAPNSGCISEKDVADYQVKYWELPTGSHIAYICFSSNDSSSSVPLIFLHGGPGAYQVSSVEIGKEWYKHLSDLGYDVYLYDQAGSGLSARLKNPAEYSVKRHIEDLEAIRKIIGKEKIILAGDSWGATLASGYMAEYPQHVIKAVFTSPGPMEFDVWNVKSTTPRIAPEILYWVRDKYGNEKYNRYLKLDSLLQTDLAAAFKFAGDEEMDPLADSFLNEVILESTVHSTQNLEESGLEFHGAGWWVMTMTIWDASNNSNPVSSRLYDNNTPVLILRGNSDYLPSEIAELYSKTFKQSHYIKIPECGHLIWLEKPDIYTHEIEVFLLNTRF